MYNSTESSSPFKQGAIKVYADFVGTRLVISQSIGTVVSHSMHRISFLCLGIAIIWTPVVIWMPITVTCSTHSPLETFLKSVRVQVTGSPRWYLSWLSAEFIGGADQLVVAEVSLQHVVLMCWSVPVKNWCFGHVVHHIWCFSFVFGFFHYRPLCKDPRRLVIPCLSTEISITAHSRTDSPQMFI